MIYVSISGHDIYETLSMPEVPRKGDRLWLNSLMSREVIPSPGEVIVSKVEWVRDQTARFTGEHEGIYARLTVRRLSAEGGK